jgi:hypothetical protein
MKIETIALTDPISDTSTDYVIITKDDDCFTSMPKSVYDEMQVAQELIPAFPVTTEPLTEQTQEGAE